MDPATGRLVEFDQAFNEAGSWPVAGVDEAGRGCWAGPVVAAAVILPLGWCPDELDDSKRLSPGQRNRLFAEIRSTALCWRACAVSAGEIDHHNILQATLLAMSRAVSRLQPSPRLVLVDGKQIPVLPCPGHPVVGGDGKSAAIAAASVVAKVLRDRIMVAWDRIHPEYGFAKHKGYGSERHRVALLRWGPCPLHRRSYRPVASMQQTELWNKTR